MAGRDPAHFFLNYYASLHPSSFGEGGKERERPAGLCLCEREKSERSNLRFWILREQRQKIGTPRASTEMDWPMRSSITLAATFSGIAFMALLVGVPTMLQEVANMESELMLERQEYLDMSNTMWKELMQQGDEIRVARSTFRHRRQYDGNAGSGGDAPAKEAVTNSKCPVGPKGPAGLDGEDGMDGMDGMPGQAGLGAGPEDNPYDAPSGCEPCPAGPAGLPGYKGKRGPRGPKGEKGAPGNPGRDGELGEEGPEGDLGYQGDLGPPGERGPAGEDGIGGGRGPPGPKGPPGADGEMGDEGQPGERGDDAAPGPPGEPGPAGKQGEPGKAGHPGLRGKPGTPGEDAEYCPCPARSKGDSSADAGASAAAPAGDDYSHAAAAAEAAPPPPAPEAKPAPAPAPIPVAPASAPEYPESGYASQPSTPGNAVYSKYAHAAALRRRHF